MLPPFFDILSEISLAAWLIAIPSILTPIYVYLEFEPTLK